MLSELVFVSEDVWVSEQASERASKRVSERASERAKGRVEVATALHLSCDSNIQ